MANPFEDKPFSEMTETETVTERTFGPDYEAPYSYEPDDDMIVFMEQRYDFDKTFEADV